MHYELLGTPLTHIAEVNAGAQRSIVANMYSCIIYHQIVCSSKLFLLLVLAYLYLHINGKLYNLK